MNNQEIEHTNNENNTTQKVALVNSTTDTLNCLFVCLLEV